MKQAGLDILGVGGLGLFLYGAHQVYPPAALMLGGLVAMVVAATAAKRSGK